MSIAQVNNIKYFSTWYQGNLRPVLLLNNLLHQQNPNFIFLPNHGEEEREKTKFISSFSKILSPLQRSFAVLSFSCPSISFLLWFCSIKKRPQVPFSLYFLISQSHAISVFLFFSTFFISRLLSLFLFYWPVFGGKMFLSKKKKKKNHFLFNNLSSSFDDTLCGKFLLCICTTVLLKSGNNCSPPKKPRRLLCSLKWRCTGTCQISQLLFIKKHLLIKNPILLLVKSRFLGSNGLLDAFHQQNLLMVMLFYETFLKIFFFFFPFFRVHHIITSCKHTICCNLKESVTK